ncbi:MAG TPA: hypothetical protein VK724_17465 [Bryobacteraceae bacterium]|jgi:hypothetical protein|nr:hypothetical protein [Bryobacteraceae bacterium]
MPQSFCCQSVTAILASFYGILACSLLSSCRAVRAQNQPSIEFTRVPPAGEGSQDRLEPIAGHVSGARPGERIVLFSQSGKWWVQPFDDRPYTSIQPDSTWKTSIHPGSAYAALLVDSRFRPPPTVNALPETGGPVLAAAVVKGSPSPPQKMLQFSGYRWESREAANDPGGSKNFYDPANAWTDQDGFLHLRIVKQADRWVSSEVRLSRSLGYGSYSFVVRDVSQLEPAAVFAMFTWDDAGPSREMDIEVSRWGEPEDKNAQYVVQPYVVPANTVRFMAPQGTLTYWIKWLPGRVEFKTVRGSDVVADHVFTSGVPSPGDEKIHLNLYVYNNQSNPLRNGSEVIIEKFAFLP